MHYPTREQYGGVMAAYNAALEKCISAAPPGAKWFCILVTLTIVTSPYFVWRESKTYSEAQQAMKQEIVATLRDCNEQLDADWRQRQLETETGQESSRRWQRRWIGLYVERTSYVERLRLALVHIAQCDASAAGPL